MKKTCTILIKTLLLLGAITLISGCGDDETIATSGGNLGGGTTGGGTTQQATYSMGSGSGDAHQSGMLDIAINNLAAGGSTSVSATIVDQNGTPYAEPIEVTFISGCVSTGLATINSPVTATAGTATTTYSAIGCSGDDVITATADVEGQSLTATGSVNVAPSEVGSIQFISAEPQTIALRGTGLDETSTVTFKVVNSTGGPVPDAEVSFRLSADSGGLEIDPPTAVSGTDGTVSTIVQSGASPTSVRVIASVQADNGTTIETQSSSLTVTTAIADQDSFTISPEVLNPEAWSANGVEVAISILAADRYNNPVPDGTAIVFTTELGSVQGQCTTIDGACTVNWISQEPRTVIDTTGRSTIIAHALGEESFTDVNSNGIYDAGEPFVDLPEAWLDINEDGNRDANELFVDFNSDGSHNSANGEFDGVLCNPSCANSNVTVRNSFVLVMARSVPDIYFFDGNGAGISEFDTVQLPEKITTCVVGANTAVFTGSTLTQGQPMPFETTIELNATKGEIPGKSSFEVGSTNSQVPKCITLRVEGSETGERGLFEITVTTPGGTETYANVDIMDTPKPTP